jgi:hypothetical protein
MLPLRFPWLWLLLGWGLVAGVIYGSVTSNGIVRAMPIADDIEHACSYGLLMIWFAGLYARNRTGWIAVVVLTLGLVLEIIQSQLSYRTFDPSDLLANALGVTVGFMLSFWVLAGWCLSLETRIFSRNAGR